MTSRATEKVMGGGGVVWSYFLPFPLAAGAYIAGGGVDERSSLRLSLPRPLPCPFLPLPLPLSAGLPLPLPLPLAMSGSIGLKFRISIERNGSEAGPTAIPGGRRGVVPGAPTGVTPACCTQAG